MPAWDAVDSAGKAGSVQFNCTPTEKLLGAH